MGDSWGTISPATEHFEKELKEHNCPLDGFTNIAVGGTTAEQWSTKEFFEDKVKTQAVDHDLIWVTLMGNDAFWDMPDCADEGKTASECGDLLINNCHSRMGTILDMIHEKNPNAHVVGFGYDIMFGGVGCEAVAKKLFPQCWKNETASAIRCFNTEFTKVQAVWEKLASERSYVTAINLLGATQVAYGDKDAAVGKPNLDMLGPAKYWPLSYSCIHPSTTGGDASGAMVIMKEFYKQFWSTALSC